MNFYESKPDFQMTSLESEFKKEPPWQDVEPDNSGDQEEQLIRKNVTATRKRQITSPITKKVYKSPAASEQRRICINNLIATCFSADQHPSVDFMIQLSEKSLLTFREVFEEFEQLRHVSNTRCLPYDTCARTRHRFEVDQQFCGVSCYRSNIRPACSDIFKQIDLKDHIDDKYVHLILEQNRTKRQFTPAAIRQEWNMYRIEIHKILEMSRFQFPNDQLYFATNQHPTVPQMVSLASKVHISYKMVFERFVELRFAKRVTCAEDDVCQIIRNSMRPTQRDLQIDDEIRERLAGEYVKFRLSETGTNGKLDLSTVHTIAVALRLPIHTVEVGYVEWNKSMTYLTDYVFEQFKKKSQMDLSESKPEFQLIDLEVKTEEEPNWSECSFWNEEKPVVLGTQQEGSSSISHIKETKVKTRKRLAEPPISHIPNKSTVNSPARIIHLIPALKTHGIVVHPGIAASFVEAEHPSVQLMIDLSEKYYLPFREVFNQFEQLRLVSGTTCSENDPCIRTQSRFEVSKFEKIAAIAREICPKVLNACLDTFRTLELTTTIHEKYIHLILETSPPELRLTPSCVRRAWYQYRRHTFAKKRPPNHSFPNDLQYFSKNAHPSVQEMFSVSRKAQVPYKTVYDRFEVLRKTIKVVCAENDTCQTIKKLAFSPGTNVEVDEGVRDSVEAEFEKLRSTKTSLPLELPHHLMHLLLRYDLSFLVTRELYLQWMKPKKATKPKTPRQPRVPVDCERWTTYTNVSMDFNETKPEFELLNSEFEIKEEQVWQDAKKEPGSSMWYDVGNEGKPTFHEAEEANVSHISEEFEIKQEQEWNEVGQCSDSYQIGWNGKQEDIKLEEVEWEKEQEKYFIQEPISDSAKTETRKRTVDHPICPSASKKLNVMPIGTVKTPVVSLRTMIHAGIATLFSKVKHPSVQLMIDLSEKYHLSFRDVFMQFEELRRVSRTACPRNDACTRTRHRFQINNSTVPHGFPSYQFACLDIFDMLELTPTIDEKYVHLILEGNLPELFLTPACIRHEWNLYKRHLDGIPLTSENRFPNDLYYFARTPHPSVQNMLAVSFKEKVPYKQVYDRFEELRYAKRVTCVENDTCQTIKRLTQSKDNSLQRVKRDLVIFEIMKLGSRLPVELPHEILHSAMVRSDLSMLVIQRLYEQWKSLGVKRASRVPVDLNKWTTYKYT